MTTFWATAVPYLWEFSASSSGPDGYGVGFTSPWIDSAGMGSLRVAAMFTNPIGEVVIEEAVSAYADAPASALGAAPVRVTGIPAATEPVSGDWPSHAYYGEVDLAAKYFRLLVFADEAHDSFDICASLRGVPQ